jgi:hypothetical protein
MNLLDCYVTKVLGEPVWHAYPELPDGGYWTVNIIYDCYGGRSTGLRLFKTLEEAQKVAVGDHFLT